MDSKLITILISLFTAGATSYIAYYFSIKTNIRNKEEELKREQAYKYFLPLKFASDELFYRLIHIENKIHDKVDVNIQLPQDLNDKTLDWYFVDWKNYKEPSEGAGGYFLVTAVYMHCLLYNRINNVLKEFPFLEVKLDKSLVEIINLGNDEQIERCMQSITNDVHTMKWVNIESFKNFSGKIKLEELIRLIRLSAVMKGGIPYGLQTAFGQFIETYKYNKVEQMNYEEFAKLLMQPEHRVKFQPLISFYTELIDSNFNIESTKLIKLRALIVSLLLIRNANI